MTRSGTRTEGVVQGTEPGGVFPATRGDLKKRLLLDGREEPFDVQGGVYAPIVRSVGPGTVRGPILAGESVRLEAEAPGIQRLLGGVSAGREISTHPVGEGAADLDTSPAASPNGIRFVIRGDVAAGERVTLRNTLVLGSVKAPAVRLESSIVFGQITAWEGPGELHAVCGTFGVYHARRLIVEGPTTILVAGGSSEEAPDLRDHEPADGDGTYPFSMRLLSLCRHGGIGCGLPNSPLPQLSEIEDVTDDFPDGPGICCAYWLHHACPFRAGVALGRADFSRTEADADMLASVEPEQADTRERDPNGDGTESEGAFPTGESVPDERSRQKTGRWFFGLQNRAQDLTPLVESDAFFDSVLHRVFAYEHLSDETRGRLLHDLESDHLSRQEARLLFTAVEGVDDRGP